MNIYKYKTQNIDILPQLLNFSKSLKIKNTGNINIDALSKYQKPQKITENTLYGLLNKLCKTNIATTCKKIHITPVVTSEILNYKTTYYFDNKSSFVKAECIAKLLLQFNNPRVNKTVLNVLQEDFQDFEYFINNRLVLIQQYYINGKITNNIFKVILGKLFEYSYFNANISALLILLSVAHGDIIQDNKNTIKNLSELPKLCLKDKFALLAIINE